MDGRWSAYGEIRKANKILVEEGDYSKHLGIDERIILKLILGIWLGQCGLDSCGSRSGL
jgi:hypothetical protein